MKFNELIGMVFIGLPLLGVYVYVILWFVRSLFRKG
jgi:hypothetical protein